MLDTSSRANYLFNTTIAGIEQADVIVLVGANPRKEASLVNARIRKRWRTGGLKVINIGEAADLTYDVQQLGNDPRILSEIATGKHAVSQLLKDAKYPMIIVGSAALARTDGAEIFAAAKKIAGDFGLVKEGWNGFNVLHHAASRVGALDVGFVPASGGKNIAEIFAGTQSGDIKMVYLLGADEFDTALLGKAFVVYQGHHGDDGAHRADVVLPGAAYTEKEATYVNMEGRPQRGKRAVFPPGQAKEDWAILRSLSDMLGKPLPYHNLPDLRARIAKEFPHFAAIGAIQPAVWKAETKTSFAIAASPFLPFVTNFYMTDPISRASRTMAECVKNIANPNVKKVA